MIIIDDGIRDIRRYENDRKFGWYISLIIMKGKCGSRKRNLMLKNVNINDNDIIVYMDNDDFNPPERVSHM